MDPLVVRPDLTLPAGEIELDFARAGGPGGQNVNKVESKVVLRFGVTRSRTLDERQRARLLVALAPRLTSAGDLVLHAARFRDRARNVEDALQRLAQILRAALDVQKPRRATRPTRAAGRRRLDGKRRRGDIKRGRRGGEE